VQVSYMNKFYFERQQSDPSWKNGFRVKCQIVKTEERPIIIIGDRFPMVLMVRQMKLAPVTMCDIKSMGFLIKGVVPPT